jgi:uncharacterized protein YcbK (DUF882 family)
MASEAGAHPVRRGPLFSRLFPRRLAYAAFAAAASLPVTSPIAIDRPLPEMPQVWWSGGRGGRGGSLVTRKEKGASEREREGEDEGAAVGPVPTMATLVQTHTGELLVLSETEPTTARLSAFLEDRAMKSRVEMSPALLDMLRSLVRERRGARIEIVSGYRSPKRNEMMRKKGRNVASHSQHTLGMALDFRVEGMGVGDVVKALEELGWSGGLGRYDAKHDRFVHVDVGPRRRCGK